MLSSNFFITRLKNKIIDSNARSIFVNAHPQKSNSKLDLYTFQELSFYKYNVNLPLLLLDRQSFKFSYKIDLNHLLSSRLNSMLINFLRKNDDYINEYNLSPFGIGYPLVQVHDQKNRRVNFMPVFIFKLQIKGGLKNVQRVTIQRSNSDTIYINPSLINYIRSHGRSINIKSSWLEGDLFDCSISLNELLSKVLEALIIENAKPIRQSPLSPLDAYTPTNRYQSKYPKLINNGVFGLYSNSKESIIRDYRKLEQINLRYNFKASVDNIDHMYSGVLLDHSQQRVIRALSEKKDLVIHGPPGTGKSKTITSIIAHALSQNKTCILVCEKKTAMDVIHKNLSELGLGEFSVKITDVKKDRRIIVDQVRDSIDTYRKGSNSLFQKKSPFEVNVKSEAIIDNKADKLKKTVDLINRTKSKLSTPLFETSMSYAEYALKYFKQPSSEFIRKFSINPREFDFSSKEFYELRELLEKFLKEYKEIISSKSIYFTILKDEILRNESVEGYQELQIIFNSYAQKLLEFKTIYEQLKSTIPPLTLKYYDPDLNSNNELEHYRGKLKSFVDKIFSHQLFKPSQRSKIRFSPLDNQLIILDDLINAIRFQINNHKRYHELFKDIKSRTYRDQLLLENYLEYENFQIDFFQWYIFQKIKSFPIDYIDFNGYEKGYHDMEMDIQVINDYIISKTLYQLDQNRFQSFINYENQNKNLTIEQLFAKRSTKDRAKLSLTQITNHESKVFPSFYPIVITNPTSCANLFPMEAGYFDFVIFDESSQLKVEDTYTSLLRGKQKIVAGDLHQLPPMDYFSTNTISSDDDDQSSPVQSKSLLEYCISNSFEEYYLDIHYRSKHPKLIEFSNNAFYKSRLISLPPIKEYKPIEFYQVHGSFIKRVNKEEAMSVVAYIKNNINEHSSVGVATFSIVQMDEILNQIAIESTKDIKFHLKMKELNSNGFFVKNLENIQGEERDIMIISTTYGINEEGKFLEFLGPINTKSRGHKLLNVIITRSIHKMVVFTSIPHTKINEYKTLISSNGLSGKSLLYAFLSYAKAVSDNDDNRRDEIVQILQASNRKELEGTLIDPKVLREFSQHFTLKLNKLSGRDFKVELNYSLGGFIYEIALKEDHVIKVVIDINGKDISGDYEDYLFDINRAKIIKNLDLMYYRLWISNYITNPTHELNKINKMLTE